MSIRNVLKVAIFLAIKNLFHNKSLLATTVLVISLSFISVTFISALISSVTETTIDQLIEKQYGNIVIEPRKGERYLSEADALLKKLRSIPGVSAAPRISLAAVYLKKGKPRYSGFGFYGIDPEEEVLVTNVHKDLSRGEYLSRNSRGEIVMGTHIAGGEQYVVPNEETLQAEIGDTVKVAFGNGKMGEFRIRGIVNPRDFYAVMNSYITIEDAEKILGISNQVSWIAVRVEKGREDYYVNKLKELGISGEIKTWKDKATVIAIATSLFSSIDFLLTAVGLIIVLAIISIVVYINIEYKKKQIGILKAVGIGAQTIVLSYVFLALFYGAAGIVLGVLLLQGIANYLALYPLDMVIGYISPAPEAFIVSLSAIMILLAAMLGAAPSLRTTLQGRG